MKMSDALRSYFPKCSKRPDKRRTSHSVNQAVGMRILAQKYSRDAHDHESDRHAHFRVIDPQLLSSYGTGDVVILGRDIIYRSIYLFIEHI